MRLSTRNQLAGTVAAIEVGSVMTIFKLDLDGGRRRQSPATGSRSSD